MTLVQAKTAKRRIPNAAGLVSLLSGLLLLIFDSTAPLLNQPCLIISSTGKRVCGYTFNYPAIVAGIILTIIGATLAVPYVISHILNARHHGVLSSKNERKIMIVSGVAVVAFLFFVPVVQTTVPPPTYHFQCQIPCMPFIATHVYGSATYWFFGYGGMFPGHYGDFRYYSIVWG